MKIRPLTHKMKNRLREHGDEWFVVRTAFLDANAMMIQPESLRNSDEPYLVRVVVGKDIEIVDEIIP